MYIHTYVHTNVFSYTYMHTYIHTYIRTNIHTCTYIHAYVNTYMHTYIYTYIHTYIHTYMNAHIQHAYIIHRAYIHTATYKLFQLPSRHIFQNVPPGLLLAPQLTKDNTSAVKGPFKF